MSLRKCSGIYRHVSTDHQSDGFFCGRCRETPRASALVRPGSASQLRSPSSVPKLRRRRSPTSLLHRRVLTPTLESTFGSVGPVPRRPRRLSLPGLSGVHLRGQNVLLLSEDGIASEARSLFSKEFLPGWNYEH